jgi:thiamine biosynthesis protein ThiS
MHLEQIQSLEEVIRTLELQGDRIAVELNKQIIRRPRWGSIKIQDRDRLEIVQFVGGG